MSRDNMMDIDRANEILDEIAEEIPEEFYHELNGGILLLPEAKRSPYARGDDLYILGEYVRNQSMGRMIKIYYGSFEKMFLHMPEEYWIERFREVLYHEFTHHLEFLAGERGLEIKDEKQIQEYLKRH